MIQMLIAAATLLAPAPSSATPVLPDAKPAIWVVNDHDTIIYLFGTFHALDGKSAWFNDEIATAFAESDELVLETIIPKPGAAFPAPTGAERANPMSRVAGSASFLRTTKLVMSAGRAGGMSTAKGADTILRDAAEAVGKPVAGLETLEFQFGMFSRMPAVRPPADAAQAAAASRAVTELLTRLQAAWNRGDVDSFAPMLEEMRAKSPESYRLMFADRNARWADWIARRLEQPGTIFVAVGAGHLAGSDSVQAKLAGLGVKTARLN